MIERQSLTKAKYDNSKRWLGELPLHWKPTTVRAITKPITKRDRPDLPLLSVYRDYGVILKDSRDDNHNRPGENLSSYKVVEPGNLVLNKMKTWQGSLGVSELHGIVSPAYIVCELHGDINPRFIHYLLRSYRYIFEYNRISYGVRVDQWDMHYEDFKQIPIYLPPRPEQDAIVAFLDEKLADIDRYIAAKQRLIELLDEQKAAIINQAVTRGLDPAVERKESGVEWLGEIPAHWSSKRARFLFKEIDERSETGEEELLSVSHITGVTPRSEKNIYMFKAESYVGYKLCFPGDLVINIMWAWMGALGVSNYTGIVSSSYGVYRLKHPELFRREYLDLLLRTKQYVAEYTCRSTGITSSRLRMYTDDFFDVPIIYPSISEQDEILQYIKEKTAVIDTSITKAEREITLMQELRTALIAEAVTVTSPFGTVPVTSG